MCYHVPQRIYRNGGTDEEKDHLFIAFFVCSITSQALGADIESRLKALEETIQQQGKTIEEQQRVINELKGELKREKKEETAKVGISYKFDLPTAPLTVASLSVIFIALLSLKGMKGQGGNS
jgi:hypothetical protein